MSGRDSIGLQDFIEAFEKSSQRTRQGLLLALLATTLLFGGWYNARPDSTFSTEYRIVKDAQRFCGDIVKCAQRPPSRRESRRYEEAKKFLEKNKNEGYVLETWGDLDLLRQSLAVDLTRRRAVSIPVIGMEIAVEDFVFVGSIVIFIFIFSMRYSLLREQLNAGIIYDRVKHCDQLRRDCFELISMSQVLLVPPRRRDEETHTTLREVLIEVLSRAWTRLPKLMFGLPVLVNWYVALSLAFTRVGPAITIGSGVGFVHIAASSLLTADCYRLVKLNDSNWDLLMNGEKNQTD